MVDRYLSSKLRSAINSGDHKSIQRLVKGGVDVNAKFWYDSTLLHEAVSMSSMELVEMLIRAGARVNSVNQDGRTALHLACRGGHLGIVQALISAETNLNKRTLDGKTCLHVAVWRGYKEIVQLLVDAGIDVNIPCSEGCTALYYAARSNDISTLKVLVGAGAKINYRTKSKWTPLHTALHMGHTAAVRYLLLQGAETNITVGDKTVVSMLMKVPHISQEKQQILSMLVTAGYNLHKDSWFLSIPSPSASCSLHDKSTSGAVSSSLSQLRPLQKKDSGDISAEPMVQWLTKKRETLPTLTCMCRTRVRKRLIYCNKGRSIENVVSVLPLPCILKDFISFKNDPYFFPDRGDKHNQQTDLQK